MTTTKRKPRESALAAATENKILPNSWQTPNVFMDKYNPYLTSDEWRVLSYACRHIFGWQDMIVSRMRRISVSFFENGYNDYPGCGLSRPTITKVLESLSKYGLLIKVGEATLAGQMWAIPSSEDQIDFEGLKARYESRHKKQSEKMGEVREKRSGKSDLPAEDDGQYYSLLVNTIYQYWLMRLTNTGKYHLRNQIHSQNQVSNTNTSSPSGEQDGTQPTFEEIPLAETKPFEEFVETLDIEEDGPDEKTLLGYAVRAYFNLKKPGKEGGGSYSHQQMLINFFTGKMNAKTTRQKSWLEAQFDDEPFTADEIIGFASWWEDKYPDADLPAKPETIREWSLLFRASKGHEKYLANGHKWLLQQVEKDKPKPETTPDETVPVIDVERNRRMMDDFLSEITALAERQANG